MLEFEGLKRSSDLERAINLIKHLEDNLESLAFVDVKFDATFFTDLHELSLNLTTLKLQNVDLTDVDAGSFSPFILGQKKLNSFEFHGVGMTNLVLNEIGRNLHTTAIKTLKIDFSNNVSLRNVQSNATNNWRMDNLTSFTLGGVASLDNSLMMNIFSHHNETLKVR